MSRPRSDHHDRDMDADRLREVNEALLVSSMREQELAEQAEEGERAARAGEARAQKGERVARAGESQIRDLYEKVQQTEQALRESERRFRTMVDALPAAIYTTDAQGCLTHFNPACIELSGRVPELGSDSWCVTWKLFHPDGRPMPHDECPMAVTLKTGKSVCGAEAIAEGPDGSRIWFTPYPTPLFDEAGNLIGGINMLVDITERKQSEAALRESEQRYRTLFNAMDEGYCVIEVLFDDNSQPVDYRFIEVNGSFERQAGMHDVVGKRMLEFVSDIESHWLRNYGDVALTGRPIRFSGQYKGLHRYFDVYAFRAEGWPDHHVAVLFQDITARVEAEQALRESEQRYKQVVDQVKDYAIFSTDRQGRAITWNQGVKRILGFDKHEFIGRNIIEAIFTPEDAAAGVADEELKTAAEKGIADNTRWMRRRGGERFFAEGSTTARKDEHGQVIGFTKVMRDITEHHRAQAAGARLAAIVTSSDDAIISTDINGVIQTWNRGAEHLFGYTAEEAVGKPVTILIPEDHLDEEPEILWRIRRGESVEHYETVRRRKDGTLLDISLTVSPIKDAQGHVIGASKVARDITASKQAETALRESSDRYQLAERVSRAGTFEFNIQTGLNTWTPELEAMYGLKPGEFAKTQPAWEELVHPDDRAAAIAQVDRAIRTGEPMEGEWRVVWPDGSVHWLAARFQCFKDGAGRPLRLAGINIDLTQRKQAEQTLREQAQTLEALNRVGAVLAAELDTQKLIQSVTDAGTRLSGAKFGAFFFNAVNEQGESYSLYTLSGAPREAFDGFDLPRNTPVFAPTFTGQGVIRSDDITKDRRYGRMAPHHGMPKGHLPVRSYLAVPVMSRSGTVLGGLFFGHPEAGVFSEQSERLVRGIAAQAAIAIDNARLYESARQSEARFRMLADNIDQLAWTCDATLGNATWYNQRWLDYTGLSFEDMKGWDWSKVHHPDHVDRVLQSIERSRDTGEPWEDTFPIRGADGQYRWFLSRAMPIHDDAGAIVRWFGTNTDITRRLELEQRISEQSEQIASESRRKDEFLAMLSHELRNPLAPIRSAVHLMRGRASASEDIIAKQAREIIERQVNNLTKLVSDLLEVSRVISGRIRLNQQIIDLNQIARHAIETAMPLFHERNHELVFHDCASGGEQIWVNGDATRLEEVFINLLNNAAKYTSDGGKIEVWCELVGPTLRAGSPGSKNRAAYAQIRVRDNGIGIDEQLLPRIFDLFTQADRSLARSAGGLGIGLSLAHRLIEMHGGTIEAFSPALPQGEGAEHGPGSEFIVRLDAIEAPERPVSIEPAEPALEDDSESTRPRVLVVDDNMDLVLMLATTLRQKGYSVQSAYTGPDALKAAQQWRPPPDIILLDIGLPGLDGYEVARRLRSDKENFDGEGFRGRLIALTGYGRDADVDRAREAGFDAHLVKPYDFQDLEALMKSPSCNTPTR